jgi:hypothetical protein
MQNCLLFAVFKGYIIKDNSIHYSVSSKHRQTQRYVNTLRAVLMEMCKLLKRTGMAAVGRRHRANSSSTMCMDQDSGGGIWGENGHTPGKPALKKEPPPADRWLDTTRQKPDHGQVPESLPKLATENMAAPQDDVPHAPTRRGSLFTGYTRRASMDNTRLCQTGISLGLGSAALDEDKEEEDNDEEEETETSETDRFAPSNQTCNETFSIRQKPDHREPLKPGIKKKGPESLPKAYAATKNTAAPQDDVPHAPTRRGSLFTGYTRRASMDNTRLCQTGISLGLGSAALDEDGEEEDNDEEEDETELSEMDHFGPSNRTFNITISSERDTFGDVSAISFNTFGDSSSGDASGLQ